MYISKHLNANFSYTNPENVNQDNQPAGAGTAESYTLGC